MGLDKYDSNIFLDSFSLPLGSISTSDKRVTTLQGLDELAMASVTHFYRTLLYLTIMDPTSSLLVAIRQRYPEVFPVGANFGGLIFYHTMTLIDALVTQDWGHQDIWRSHDGSPGHRHTRIAWDIAEVARVEYQRERQVAKWILHFAFYSLDPDLQLPTSAIVDCMKIIATDLDCRISNTVTLRERYLPSSLISTHCLTKK